ncbi:hypothetical protein AMATHDRAFT_58385 [Amanita thiersii Skay4041]|uniref:Carboxypeptidase n=1 Tax=Amanita thiersii Skay4041 TaxID=703135 RepID=A0A2A9NP10_9AGAR|nr:hypothetical protein AMATHDRAFT_58385 [Amanita thiersii Skay4041]
MARSAGSWSTLAFLFLLFIPFVMTQIPNSFPHEYPGQPKGDFSPEWQKYFEINKPLPNVTFPLARSFAGNIPVQREGHPNNTLFFFAVEKSNGSLTATEGDNDSAPWGIWLNGGPGSSSMYGMFFENGPIRIASDYSISSNPHSWNQLADFFWIDQPVGVGYSTADADGYAPDEDQVGKDFMGFLNNLVKIFPSLAKRPLHITGESYAGVYIPYILKAYFEMNNPPVQIAKVAIGDGSITSAVVFELLPALNIIETYPQLIGYDSQVYEYFREQSHLCGFDVNLTYPQTGIIPEVHYIGPTQRDSPFFMRKTRFQNTYILKQLQRRAATIENREDTAKKVIAKRDLTGRANGTIDPWYGCALLDEFIDYALNFTFPWNAAGFKNTFEFNVYDIPDSPINPPVNADASIFLNDPQTRAALHAPTSKDWALNFQFPFGASSGDTPNFDPSPEPMVFLTELATNATKHNIGIVLFSGNDDALIAHRSTEIAIQNTTFGGIQGFTRKPSTPWYNDDDDFAGIVHQERGWTYVLFDHAGHIVPASAPVSAFTFAREFVFGSNTTGLVSNKGVIGGEDAKLASGVLSGNDAVYVGSGATQSTYVFPSATRAAWDSFIQTARPLQNRVASASIATRRCQRTLLSFFITTFTLGWTMF